MDAKIIQELRKFYNSFACCRVSLSNDRCATAPTTTEEAGLEIRTNLRHSQTESDPIQYNPKVSKGCSTHVELFKLTTSPSPNNPNHSLKLTLSSSASFLSHKSTESKKSQEQINKKLWKSAEQNKSEMCKELLTSSRFGFTAEINSRSPCAETALQIASRLGHEQVCQAIIEFGQNLDINAKDFFGRTALHLSCKAGHFGTSQLLIRSGAIINSKDNKGNSAIHYAILSKNVQLVKFLVRRFPGLDEKNFSGVSPADLLLSININMTEESLSVIRTETQKSEEEHSVISTEENIKLSQRDFEAIQLLGRGSFGEVYLVKMITNGQLFAMKVLRKEKIIEKNLVKYAFAERDILTKLSHPFIVKLNYAFQSEDKLYLVLDYCSGGNLTYYLSKEKHFTEDMAKVYMCEIVLALEELHNNGIIYRDLKPDNIVLDGQGHCLLTDFGLSKQEIEENYLSNSFCGSVAYLAPEMLKRTGHGKSVDWYLLGVLFYEMLIGFPPFYSTNREQLFRNIEHSKARIPARVSCLAKDLIKRLLKKDPEKRIGTSRDAAEIKEHPFFAYIDWGKALKKELIPPLIPKNMLTPAFVPKFHMNEKPPEDSEMRHLQNWTFIAE